MGKATKTRARDGHTLESFSAQICALSALEPSVREAYVIVYRMMANNGDMLIGHFEDFYVWEDAKLNTPLPEGAILVYTRM